MAGPSIINGQRFFNPVTGRAYAGAKATYTSFATGEKLSVYSDYGLNTELSNPVIADAYGQFPFVYLDEDDEFYSLRVTQSSGAAIPFGDSGAYFVQQVPIIGPSTGSGSEAVAVDPNAIFQPGWPIWIPITGTLTGWVRMNGRTIGSASSGASERANSDTEDLYTFIWTNYADAICAVTGGRGISASSDFAANKPIATLDMRSRGPFGLDDMGGSALSAFTGVTFGKGNATTAGASGGVTTVTLTADELPAADVTVTITDPGHTHTFPSTTLASSEAAQVNSTQGGGNGETDESTTGITATGVIDGGGESFDTISPFMLGSWYWKL